MNTPTTTRTVSEVRQEAHTDMAHFIVTRAGGERYLPREYQWFGKYVLAMTAAHAVATNFEPVTVEDMASILNVPPHKAGWVLNLLSAEGHLRKRVRKVKGAEYAVAYFTFPTQPPTVVIEEDDEGDDTQP